MAVLVRHLQVHLAPHRLRVGQARGEVAVDGRCLVVLNLVVNGVVARGGQYLVIVDMGIRLALAGAVPIASLGIQRKVAAGLPQTAVHLHRTADVKVRRRRVVAVLAMIHAYQRGKRLIVGKWVVRQFIGVVGKRCALAGRAAAAATPREVGPQEDVRHRVGAPLYPVVERHVAVAVRVLVPRVGVSSILVLEALRVAPRLTLALREIAVERAVQLQQGVALASGATFLTLNLHVHGHSARLVVRHAAALRVVGITDERELLVAHEAIHHCATRIAVMRAVCPVDVAKPASLAILLYCKVEHRTLLPIINSRNAGIVALLVVGLHLIHDVGR